ncbi:zinc dependent phospholipase C family protein [Fundidesulfovibrio butyratiphilus]
MIRILLVVALTVAALAAPDNALAWGPGVHLAVSRFVLSNVGLLPAVVAALLLKHKDFFVYGSLAADFFVGKGSRNRPGHSHNWESGLALLETARSERLQAYSLGYLSHLAADVLAHNYYVPSVLTRSPAGGSLAHVYVEAQADSRLTGGAQPRAALAGRGQRAADLTLAHALRKDFFTLSLRKRLFRGGESLSRAKAWNSSLRLAQRVMPLPDGDCRLADMYDLSLRAVVSVLRDPHGSSVLAFDPIGCANLASVRAARRSEVPAGGRFQPAPELIALPGVRSAQLPHVA